ncbi:tripartite tricarboxylate transporter TctB family protein [Prosthecomicrobium sp. N25]|uniref:tripartite tricarboxylate transporter TctB family protein n=1 Tax=Prosthecomicrobium sp. N25 TaxID=3129254 RepID=UPI00307694D2
MTDRSTGPSPARIALAWGEALIALGVIALALLAWWQTTIIPVSPLYAKVGPTVAPQIGAAGLSVFGLALLYAAIRGGWQAEEEKETPTDRAALAWVVAGLLVNVVLIGPAGFTLASVLMFMAIARGFGSNRPVRDAGIAILFALIAYFGFAQALGIDIGRGVVENAIFSLFGAST